MPELVTQTKLMNGYFISTDKNLLQLERVHAFLSRSYWSPGVPMSVVESAAKNSMTFGLYFGDNREQVGYARIVTDHATIAYLADVYVLEEHRGKGLSKEMMTFIMETLAPMKLRRICLATKDAHDLYRKYGFEITKTPDRWMEIKNSNPY